MAKEEKVKVEGEEVEVKAPKKAKVSSVTFKLRSGAERTFSEETHGEDFEDVAKEFESNNAKNTTEGQVAHTTGDRSRIDFIVDKTVA